MYFHPNDFHLKGIIGNIVLCSFFLAALKRTLQFYFVFIFLLLCEIQNADYRLLGQDDLFHTMKVGGAVFYQVPNGTTKKAP